MPPLDFASIRRRVQLSEVLASLGSPLRRLVCGRGRGPCPLCSWPRDRGRCLTVAGPVWYCHECGRGGDVIDLVAQHAALPLVEAARVACSIAGIVPPQLHSVRPRPKHEYPLRSPRRGRGVEGGEAPPLPA